MDNQTEFEGSKCPLWMADMLEKMVRIARQKCMKTPQQFFRELFGRYINEKIKYGATEPSPHELPKFLQDAECKLINLMYNKICNIFVDKGVLSPPQELQFNNNFTEETDYLIDSITNNDILSIDCPTIFTGYHFITAVVSISGRFVDIYQSFGNRMLYRNMLSIEKFKQHLKNMKNITIYPREQALAMVKGFERQIYDNDFDAIFEDMANEDTGTIIIPKEELIDDAFDKFIINRQSSFSIKIYKFEHSDCLRGGGKRKRKTNKKSISKKSKRKSKRTRN